MHTYDVNKLTHKYMYIHSFFRTQTSNTCPSHC